MPSGIIRSITLTSIAVLLAGCATTAKVVNTYSDEDHADSSFGNILVIGVAGNYNSRAQFERTLASGIRAEGASASAYYTVVPGNDPINREAVLQAVSSGGFDAVLLTRIVDQEDNIEEEGGSPVATASTIGGRPINFFRYDYEELNEPKSINLTTTVTLSSELFSAAEEKMIWAIEVSNSDASNAGTLIDETAASIVARLRGDGFIGR
jgi:hypothetical protein